MGEAPAFFVGDLKRDLNDCDLNFEGSQTITHIGDDKYMIGATDDTLSSSIQVKVYDKFTGNWLSPTVLGTKPKLFKGHSAFPLNNDRILVVKQNSSLDDCLWFLEVGTRYVRNRVVVLGTEVVCWSKGVLGDSEKPIVISGPSGVGKGTLISKLMKEFPSMFGFSVSHTTRAPREKEKDGVHYHFMERNVMEQEIKDGKFLEFASVHGNLYGTSMEAVEVVADSGKRCILDIDVQGARSVRVSSLPAIFIFICPPSIHELERRLRSRGTETNEQIEKRIRNSSVELKEARSPGLFDHILENDDLEKCYNDLKRVLGLEAAPKAASHKSLMVVSAVLQDSRLLLTCSGNEELQKASKNISVVDVSSVKGGAPGRTRGLKLSAVDFFHSRALME